MADMPRFVVSQLPFRATLAFGFLSSTVYRGHALTTCCLVSLRVFITKVWPYCTCTSGCAGRCRVFQVHQLIDIGWKAVPSALITIVRRVGNICGFSCHVGVGLEHRFESQVESLTATGKAS